MMPERKLSVVLTFFYVFFCLILSQAQTNSPSAPSTIPPSGPQFPAVPLNPNIINQTLPTIQTAPAQGATPNINSVKQNESGGKYQEYQSLCRINEYDVVKYYIPELKKRRVELLKEKIAAGGDGTVKLKFRLIKEYADQDEPAFAKSVVTELKKEKLSAYENDFLNALISFYERNYPATIAILIRTLGENKNNIEILHFLGEVYMLVGNYYEASTIYEDLNKTTDDNYLVQLCESTVLNSLNTEAEKICAKAAAKFPESPFPLIYKGISHREREEAKRAIFAFQKSIGIKPTEMGYVCLAEAFFMKGSLNEAAENFKNALEMVSKSVRAMLGLAWTQLKLKNYKESAAAFKKACLVNVKYEGELRKAIKQLAEDKAREIKIFVDIADNCGR